MVNAYGFNPLLFPMAVLFLISAIGSGLPFGLADFIMWRILGGVAVGAASVLAPAYISEVAPARYRGALTTVPTSVPGSMYRCEEPCRVTVNVRWTAQSACATWAK